MEDVAKSYPLITKEDNVHLCEEGGQQYIVFNDTKKRYPFVVKWKNEKGNIICALIEYEKDTYYFGAFELKEDNLIVEMKCDKDEREELNKHTFSNLMSIKNYRFYEIFKTHIIACAVCLEFDDSKVRVFSFLTTEENKEERINLKVDVSDWLDIDM